MFIASFLSEALLYSCFSLLLGSFIIHLVPESNRPDVRIPKGVLLAAVLGIAIFSFLPVLKIILMLYKEVGLAYPIQSVLTNFDVGKSWVYTGVISLLLFIYLLPIKIERRPLFAITGLVFTLVLIGLLSWSSHASSLAKVPGFFVHTTHFLAVCTWVGILMVVCWFSKKPSNWLKFLKWFSPVAIICLLIIAITGISLMTFHMELNDYTNISAIPYGQSLLIKHIAIIPLLAFAFINSILVRKRLSLNPAFNPLPWARLESIIILVIFSITGALGQASPPHDISRMLEYNEASKLFSFFHPGKIDFPLHFSPGILSLALFLVAFIFLVLMIFTFIKKAPKIIALLMSLLFILTGYLGFLLSVY
jgi:putative copper export protein